MVKVLLNEKPLKIYLGDLTYDTVALSTESFPINIGYIAAFCYKKFGSKIEITLFKFINELEKALHKSAPHILGLSNYCWNQRVDSEIFKIFKEINSSGLTVWGGPNFPLDMLSQQKFLVEHPQVDIYVPIDGEQGFSNIVDRALSAKTENEIKKIVLAEPINGCIIKDLNGNLLYSSPIRLKNLDEIPSPYLTGLLDKFFKDGRLCPMIQTNRGCPFSCTFCVDGTDAVRQVNRFSIERVKAEINYIGEHVSKHIHTMYISDLNFGMFPWDLETCKAIKEIRDKYSYPHFISSNTGKNAKERIINAIKELDGSLQLMMAVQSTDQRVLTNIKRDNISVDHMMALSPSIRAAGLSTKSEIILGLPEETYQSHIETLRNMIRAKMDEILVFTLMMLPGSELNTPKERKKWNLKTKFRLLPRDFVELSNGKKIVEIEEVVVETNTLSFEGYVELMLLNFIVFVTNREVYEPLIRFLREKNVDVFELYYRMLKKENFAPPVIKDVFNKFRKATVEELWDSPGELEKNFQDEKEFQKLLRGEAGINILYYFQALVTSDYMSYWTDYALKTAEELIVEKGFFDKSLKDQFRDISNFCKGLSANILDFNRMQKNPEFFFFYDIENWLEQSCILEKEGRTEPPLSNFYLPKGHRVKFILTKKQNKIIQDNLKVYGTNRVGLTQALTKIRTLWRKPCSSNL